MATSLLDYLTKRRAPDPEAPLPMSPRPPDDARESMRRLVDLIQVLEHPNRAAEALERCVLALVVDEMRQRIIERLRTMTPEDLAAVEALTQHLEHARREPPPPESTP